ncbi:MAG: PaaI family thioesterase, partial [Desulfovibrio sp.]|nr:PaaI family thioesterase [Desulfovibrio sp.]
MEKSYLDEVCGENQEVNPLFTFLDARMEIPAKGEARLTLPVRRGLIQGGGVVAGGILAPMADEAMAHAVMTLLGEGRSTVTVEMNIRYLRPAGPERKAMLSSVARVVRSGARLCMAEADVLDEENRLLAKAGAT